MKDKGTTIALFATAVVGFGLGVLIGNPASRTGGTLLPIPSLQRSQYPTPVYVGNLMLEAPPGFTVKNSKPDSVEIVTQRGTVMTITHLGPLDAVSAKTRLGDEQTPLHIDKNKSGNFVFSHTVEKGGRWLLEGYVYARSKVTLFQVKLNQDDFETLSKFQVMIVGSRETI